MDSDLQDYPGLDINDDEAALQYAIELSLLEENHLVVSEPISETPPNQNTVMTSATTLQSLDRRMMEEERLRRLAQRKRSATEISTIPPTKKICLEELSVRTPNKALDKALHFPKGAVKKTWALGFERNQDDIKIEEVLQRSDLKLAILSSFQWDEEWLLSKVDMARTNIILVAYAQDDAQVICSQLPTESVVIESRLIVFTAAKYACQRASQYQVLFSAYAWTRRNALQVTATEVFKPSPVGRINGKPCAV